MHGFSTGALAENKSDITVTAVFLNQRKVQEGIITISVRSRTWWSRVVRPLPSLFQRNTLPVLFIRDGVKSIENESLIWQELFANLNRSEVQSINLNFMRSLLNRQNILNNRAIIYIFFLYNIVGKIVEWWLVETGHSFLNFLFIEGKITRSLLPERADSAPCWFLQIARLWSSWLADSLN